MANRTRAQLGLTLVEVLMVGAVFTLVGGTMIVVQRAGQQAWLQGDAQTLASSQAQKVMDFLRTDLHNNVSAAGPTVCTTPNQLTMTLINAAGTVTYNCANCSAQTPGTLLRTTNPATTTQTVATGVVSFAVPSCAGNMVTVSVQTQTPATATRRAVTTALTSKFFMENP